MKAAFQIIAKLIKPHTPIYLKWDVELYPQGDKKWLHGKTKSTFISQRISTSSGLLESVANSMNYF